MAIGDAQEGRGEDLKARLEQGPISRYQILAIAICFAIFILDGFDALVIAFTGPEISNALQLTGTELGALFSASLVGMAIGAIVLAPYADRYGRRPLVLSSLVIVTVGMLLSAFAGSLDTLILLRVLTGIGIGVALASVNIIVAEYSPAKSRALAIGIVQTAYPIGATLGGALAIVLIEHSGWQSVFVAGSLGSALLIPVALGLLPESIQYLASKQPPGALERINRQLSRMGRERISALPARAAAADAVGVRGLLGPAFLKSTLLLWAAFFIVMFCLYFVLSWTPKLLIESGLSSSEGISGGIVLHIGGITGQLMLGYLAARYDLRKLLAGYFGLAVIAMIAFGVLIENLPLALITAWLTGFFVLGAITGSYAATAAVYPTEIRTTALGWALGVGRIGAILSPTIAGLLLDRDVSPQSLYVLFGVTMLIGMIIVAGLPSARAVDDGRPGRPRPAEGG